MYIRQLVCFSFITVEAIVTAIGAKCGNGPYDYSPSSKLSFEVFQLVGGSVTFKAIYNVTEDDPKLYWGITKGYSVLNNSDIDSFYRSDGIFTKPTNVTLKIDLVNQNFDRIEVSAAIIQNGTGNTTRTDGGIVTLNVGVAPIVTLVQTEYCKNTTTVCANVTGKPAPSLTYSYTGTNETVFYSEIHETRFCVTLKLSSTVVNSTLTFNLTNCFGMANITTQILEKPLDQLESCQNVICARQTENCSVVTFHPTLSSVSSPSPSSTSPSPYPTSPTPYSTSRTVTSSNAGDAPRNVSSNIPSTEINSTSHTSHSSSYTSSVTASKSATPSAPDGSLPPLPSIKTSGKETSSFWTDVPVYIFAVIAVGVLLIIITFVILVVICRKKRRAVANPKTDPTYENTTSKWSETRPADSTEAKYELQKLDKDNLETPHDSNIDKNGDHPSTDERYAVPEFAITEPHYDVCEPAQTQSDENQSTPTIQDVRPVEQPRPDVTPFYAEATSSQTPDLRENTKVQCSELSEPERSDDMNIDEPGYAEVTEPGYAVVAGPGYEEVAIPNYAESDRPEQETATQMGTLQPQQNSGDQEVIIETPVVYSAVDKSKKTSLKKQTIAEPELDEDLQYAEIDLPESDLPPPPKETTVYAEMNEEQPIARTNTE